MTSMFLEFRLVESHKLLEQLMEKARQQGRDDLANEINNQMERDYLDYINRVTFHAQKYEELLRGKT